ncbi:MAG: hypothetical protein NTZ64_15615, partial [Polaromonas sp.]|nr:hypothetical protein [Polaromonas sp.]
MQHQETGALPLEWPSGGFQWKPAWRRELPCVRGIHAPPLEPLQALLANPALLADPKNNQAEYDLAKLAKAAGRVWTSWRAATLRERMAGISQLPADPDVWRELMAQAASVTTPVNVNHRPLDWVVSVCVSLHGLTFALKTGLDFWDVALKADKPSFVLLLRSLRQAIANAPEPAYQAALAVAEELRKQSETFELACAHLFAHLGEWAQAWLARHDDHRHMLRDCALPAADFLHYIQKYFKGSLEPILPGLYLQLHLNAETCFDNLAFLYRNTGLSLAVLTRMRVPQLIPALVADMEDKKVREALEKLASDYPVAVLKTLIEHNPAGRSRAIEAWTVRLALNHPGALAGVLAHLEAPVRTRFEAALQVLSPLEAPASELPALLREPPWLGAERPGELPAFDIEALPTEENI